MMQRTAYLFNRSQASSPALANNTYPTALSSAVSEEQVYHPGLYASYPALAKVARGGAGVTSKIKFQGTADMPDALIIGAGNAQISLIALAAGKSIQLAQGTTASLTTAHSTSSGLTTITMGTDASGRPADTGQVVYDYIVANLSATFTPTLLSGSGIMGGMLRAASVPEVPKWSDIESTRQDTAVTDVEHIIDAGLGGSVTVGMQVRTEGWRAIRCLGTATGAPALGDAVVVTMGLPG